MPKAKIHHEAQKVNCEAREAPLGDEEHGEKDEVQNLTVLTFNSFMSFMVKKFCGLRSSIMRILIAEDDPISRRLLEATLHKADFDIDMYSDGEAAWQALQQDDAPSLIILDWMMPGMDGIDICRKLRDKKTCCYLILLSSKEQQRDVIAGLEAGADDYVTKPFSPLELKARLATGVRTLRLQQELTQARDAMQDMLKHDVLTGLWNHSTIVEMLEAEVLRSDQCCRESLSIVLADIDHIHHINDTYGHRQGDHVLSEVAHCIRQENRQYDTAGRYSGDSFIIILPCFDAQLAQGFAERVQACFAGQVLEAGDERIEVSLSMGITVFNPGDPVDVNGLIHQAEQALSRAKSHGSGHIACAASET